MKLDPPIAALVVAASRSRKRPLHRRRYAPGSQADTHQTRIELLRYELRKAKAASKADVAALRVQYRASLPRLRAQIRAFRAKWRAWVNEQIAAWRIKHRIVWRNKVDQARYQIVKVQSELRAQQKERRDLLRWARQEREAKAGRRSPRSRKGIETKQESDDRVEQNLEPELVVVWRRMKSKIKTAGKWQTRTEAFLHWCHDNEDEVQQIQYEAGDDAIEIERYMKRLERRHYGD